MQSIAIGRLGKSVQEFYGMTLRELNNAVDGFERLKKERFEEFMYGCRIVSYWAIKGHVGKKLKRPQDLFELDVDREMRKQKLKTMPQVVVIW